MYFLFQMKSSFLSRDIQSYEIFSLHLHTFRFKRTNESGIIYDLMN